MKKAVKVRASFKKWCSNKKNGKDDNSDMLNIKLK